MSTPSGNPQFTCLSCSIAFSSADDQREHYKSDHHRYNMKRRVASLPPISAAAFNLKVQERRSETALTVSPKGSICEVCNKVYTTENAYRSHINSKKHREQELKGPVKPRTEPLADSSNAPVATDSTSNTADLAPKAIAPEGALSKNNEAEDDDDDEDETIDQRIAASRNSRLTPSSCLFCTNTSTSMELNLEHMQATHSFFVPDSEYLTDLPGLLTYLGEKIAVGNVCIYCNGKGRELRSLEAVRKHMVDKSHCKIAYDSQKDQLEVSDYYDFSSSYPADDKRKNKAKRSSNKVPAVATLDVGGEEDEWEDADDDADGEVDEVIDEDAEDDEDDLDVDQITYGDTPFELVLPSGARIGHRSMRRYYVQNFHGRGLNPTEDPNSGAALVRRLIADSRDSALVPTKGGFGAFGKGTEVVKARNRGEAREAGRHVREFRDQQRKEQFKTKVGFIHNSQKHFRDPLLQ